jgi:hypothetical protein
MDAVRAKSFPANYSERVLEIINALSMTGLKGVEVLGSASIRSNLYAGDYDTMNKVKLPSTAAVASAVKEVVARLLRLPECYIGDIKCGTIAEWDPFRPDAYTEKNKIVNFNIKESQSIIDRIPQTALSPNERQRALRLLEKATTPWGFLEARKEIRFHILRWKPDQIQAGRMMYRGISISLEEAVKTGGMIKVDSVCVVNDRYTEFSMIYDVYVGKKRLTPATQNLILALSEDISYFLKNDPFKALKRLFSLTKATGNYAASTALVPILNSDLGRLYQIIGDLKTLRDMLERPSPPSAEIRTQIDQIKSRMGNIYNLKSFLEEEHDIIGEINTILKTPASAIVGKLVKLITKLSVILNTATETMLKKLGKMIQNEQ